MSEKDIKGVYVNEDSLCMDKLKKCLDLNDMNSFDEWEWLLESLKKMLEYNECGIEKPVKLMSLFRELRYMYSYSGEIYRGYNLENYDEVPILDTSNICSWSNNFDVASRFTEGSDGLWCVLKKVGESEFYLSDFISDILNVCPHEHFKEALENYLGEDEILCPVLDYTVYRQGSYM